jgi:hypothetical protein
VITGPAGVPYAIVADGRRRVVTAIREDWLVQDRWWTDDPVDRHYYELLVEPGRIVVAFRETRSGQWFTHDKLPQRSPRRRVADGGDTMQV